MLSRDPFLLSQPSNSDRTPFLLWGLTLFFIASLLGLSMRVFWVMDLPHFEYTNVLHAHSHLAMLGWGFTVICCLLIYFLKDHIQNFRTYRSLLLANTLGSLVMALAFVLKGYAIVSIALLIFHLLIAYALGFILLKDLKKLPNKNAALLARWAIYWMFISTVGVWLLPIVIAKFGKLDPLYQASIEWFLHLQFNGWFIYSVLALLFLFLERIGKDVKFTSLDFWALQLSLVLTYALPAYWSYPLPFLNMLNSLGVLIQLLVFWRIISPFLTIFRIELVTKKNFGYGLIVLGLISLLVKITIQASLIFSLFLAASSEVHNFFIGFIHLLMLGVFTLTCLGICSIQGLLPQNMLTRIGLATLALGFLITEVILFGQGLLEWSFQMTLPFYHETLLVCTLLLPIGLALLIFSFLPAFKKVNV
jgi:hypothetical protein